MKKFLMVAASICLVMSISPSLLWAEEIKSGVSSAEVPKSDAEVVALDREYSKETSPDEGVIISEAVAPAGEVISNEEAIIAEEEAIVAEEEVIPNEEALSNEEEVIIAEEEETIIAEEEDAKFYVRYDNTIPEEDGTTHYNNAKYFPIGDIMNEDRADTSKDNYDGVVLTNDAYVEGAEKIIVAGDVNLYDSFDGDLKKYFSIVYNNIKVLPTKEVIKQSIENALGGTWAAFYDEGKIDVLWYVIKQEPDAIHVDGVLYNVSTGKTVDIGTDVPEDDGGDDVPEDEGDESVPQTPESDESVPQIVVIEDDPVPLAASPSGDVLPATGDCGGYILLLCAGLLLAAAVCVVRWRLNNN